ncbi:MAG: hypothetical protein JO010_12900 [Alphaproteobacteria bacterium]|nr:hypothetical protein [Alphaproteobacteria bacterium]
MDAQILREKAAQCRKLAHSAGAAEVAEMLRDLALDFLARAQIVEGGGPPRDSATYKVRPVAASADGPAPKRD